MFLRNLKMNDCKIIKKTRKDKFATIFVYFLSILASVFGILLNFVLARVLEANLYGEIQYYIALCTTISQFMIFGLTWFVIREAKNSNQYGQIINKALTFYCAVVSFIVPIAFYYLYNYASYRANELVFSIVILLIAFFMGINSLISSYFQGIGKYQNTILFENLLPKAIMLILTIIFLLIGKIYDFGSKYLFYYLIIYGTLAIVFIALFFRKINLHFSFSEIISISYFFGVTITYSITNEITKVLQGGLFDNAVALATISVSLSIINLISIFTNVLNNLTKPIFAKYYRLNDNKNILNTYRFNTRINSYFAIPMYIFFITNSTKFLTFFGESYLVYPIILSILALKDAVSTLTGPNGTMLSMTGHEKVELLNGGTNILIYVIFALVFSYDKIYGLSLSLLISSVVINVLKYIEVWVIFKKAPLDFKTIMTIILIILIDFACIFFLQYISNFIVWLIVGMVVGICLIVLNFIISLYRKTDFKELLRLKL